MGIPDMLAGSRPLHAGHLHALSIDLEEWHHTELVRRDPRARTGPSTLVTETQRVLSLLIRHHVRATFFVVGEVLEAFPRLVQTIADLGHEIGFHGMSHRPLHAMSPSEFEDEVRRFRELSRSILGPDRRVCGFRAPSFSLDHRSRWAIPILERWGFKYDSSIFPIRTPLYGVSRAPLGIHLLTADSPKDGSREKSLREFPPATFEVGPIRVPVGGGVYFRVLPLRWSLFLLGKIGERRPLLLYFHPWELTRADARPGSFWAHMVGSFGSATMMDKLDELLRSFRFTTVEDILFPGAGVES